MVATGEGHRWFFGGDPVVKHAVVWPMNSGAVSMIKVLLVLLSIVLLVLIITKYYLFCCKLCRKALSER